MITAVAIVIKDRKCSTSYIQRKLAIGYNKAARLVEQMEDEGVVSSRRTMSANARFWCPNTGKEYNAVYGLCTVRAQLVHRLMCFSYFKNWK